MSVATFVHRPGFFVDSARSSWRMTPHSSGSLSGLNAGMAPAFSNSAPLWTRSVAAPALSDPGALGGEERPVATIIEQHVRPRTVGPHQSLLGAPPVFLERLALP